MKSLKLISFILLSLILFSCHHDELNELDESIKSNGMIKCDFEIDINKSIGTRSWQYLEGVNISYVLDNGERKEEPFYWSRIFAPEIAYQIYSGDKEIKHGYKSSPNSDGLFYLNIAIPDTLDPSKLRIRFLNNSAFPFKNEDKYNINYPIGYYVHASTNWPVFYGDFKLADDNDWSKIHKSFILDNYSADFIVLTDEFYNSGKSVSSIKGVHSLDYKTNRDSYWTKENGNLSKPICFTDVFINMNTKEQQYVLEKHNYFHNNAFSPEPNHYFYSHGDFGVWNRKINVDNYLLIDNKKYDIVGKGSILVPSESNKTKTASYQTEDDVVANQQMKYLVFTLQTDISGGSREYYRCVIPLSSLNLQKNCLYIIKNKPGNSLFSLDNESTRGNDNSFVVNPDDIEITKIPQ